MSKPSRELPLPNVSKFSSLEQAQATLLHCWTKLCRLAPDLNMTSPKPSSQPPSPTIDDRQLFQRWLEQWEAAFTAFLTTTMATMKSDDVTQSRILKANHLTCVILAADDPPPFGNFEAEFQAIVELAGAVLRSRHLTDSPQESRSNHSPTAAALTLDVKDPLYVVMARCNQNTIRNRATELLSRFDYGVGT